MKPGDMVCISQMPSKLAAIFTGRQSGRVLRIYPKLGVVIVEFDQDHIFRLRIGEITSASASPSAGSDRR